MRSAIRAATSYLEGGPLMWMLPLCLHVNQKSVDDDDDDDDDDDGDSQIYQTYFNKETISVNDAYNS